MAPPVRTIAGENYLLRRIVESEERFYFVAGPKIAIARMSVGYGPVHTPYEVNSRAVESSGRIPSIATTQEALRELFAELRGISADVRDAGIRARLQRLERRMAGLTQEEPPTDELLDVRLSPREVDVLACAALGSTNAEIAATLVLREGTVKSYLQSAMSKLDASTRHAAVAKARRAGLLP